MLAGEWWGEKTTYSTGDNRLNEDPGHEYPKSVIQIQFRAMLVAIFVAMNCPSVIFSKFFGDKGFPGSIPMDRAQIFT